MQKNSQNFLPIGLLVVATAALIIGSQTMGVAKGEVKTGTAEGYGGTITAEVTVDGDTITAVRLTGEEETAEIGQAALPILEKAILEKQGLDGVDAVSGATWTSKGVFNAVKAALGIEEEPEKEEGTETQAVETSGISHGLGIYSSGRLGPGSDDQGVGVYSFNEAVAYVLFDEEGRILDLEVDQLEVSTPNYDGEYMPNFTGFPGQSFNADEDHDEVVDAVLEQTEESFLAQVESWKTKRERADTYKLNSGTWEQEMDIYEGFFRGKTVEEIEAWYASSCSDRNGKPLTADAADEADLAKYEALSEDEKADLDAISGATMSLNDSHGNVLGAIIRAYENRKPLEAEKIAKIGLASVSTGRLGPGSDDQGVGVYSFNTEMAGACYDADGKMVALYMDTVEVATPNYDGDHMPHLTGFPGHSYNADEDHDEVAESVREQTEDSFLAEVEGWETKRERGDTYKLNSGTWEQEMDIFEDTFKGMSAEEIQTWYQAYCSDINGKPLHGTSEEEADIAKYEALSDAEKADLDAISGATMSLSDSHGELLGTILKTWEVAKDTDITVY